MVADRILKLLLSLGIYIFLIVRPLKSGLVYPSSNFLFFVGILFLIFVWFLKSIFSGKIIFRYSSSLFLYVVFVLIAFVSWRYSIHWNEGVQFFLNIITGMLTYFLLLQVCTDEREGWKLVTAVLIGASLVSFFGLYQRFFGLEETRAWVQTHFQLENFPDSFKARLTSSRIFSTFIYPNALAGYLLMIIPLAFGFLLVFNKKLHQTLVLISGFLGALLFFFFEKTYWIGLTFLMSVLYPLLYLGTFFFTFSKGGFLVFLLMRWVAYILIFKFSPSRFKKIIFWSGFLLEAFILGFVLFYMDILGIKTGLSFQVRVDYWKAACAVIHDFPWLGVGPGSFGSIYGRYKWPGAEETRMAHQSFLQIGAEVGIIAGLIFFVIWFLPLFRGLIRILKREENQSFSKIFRISIWLAALGFFIHNMVDFDLYETSMATMAWSILALLELSCGRLRSFSLHLNKSWSKMLAILIGQGVVIALILWVRTPYQADGFWEAALRAHGQKKYSFANKMIDQSLELNPRNGYAHFLKASIAQKMGDWDRARFHYQAARKQDPFNSSFPYQEALFYGYLSRVYRQDYQSEIEECLKKSLENYSTNPQFHQKIAQFYESIGRYKEALVEYKQACQLGNDSLQLRSKMRTLKNKIET